jgi:branched-chain amino acid aminotransferase
VIKNGKTATPDQNILHGITRKRVLELDKNIEIRPISFDELIDADEVFMTATTKKILPVTMIDDIKIKDGKPGPKTIELMTAFAAMEKKSVLV